MKSFRSQGGFGAIEMLVIIAVLAIVGALGYVGYTKFIAPSHTDTATHTQTPNEDVGAIVVKTDDDLDKLSKELDATNLDTDTSDLDSASTGL